MANQVKNNLDKEEKVRAIDYTGSKIHKNNLEKNTSKDDCC
jgi:hypothetical protein